MAEEKFEADDVQTPTSEDIDMLRVLLHTVKGISPVSYAVEVHDTTADEE